MYKITDGHFHLLLMDLKSDNCFHLLQKLFRQEMCIRDSGSTSLTAASFTSSAASAAFVVALAAVAAFAAAFFFAVLAVVLRCV